MNASPAPVGSIMDAATAGTATTVPSCAATIAPARSSVTATSFTWPIELVAEMVLSTKLERMTVTPVVPSGELIGTSAVPCASVA